MKKYYECETCGKRFSTEKEAIDCEAQHREAAEREKRLKEEKKNRSEKINQLIREYISDYKETPWIDVGGFSTIPSKALYSDLQRLLNWL